MFFFNVELAFASSIFNFNRFEQKFSSCSNCLKQLSHQLFSIISTSQSRYWTLFLFKLLNEIESKYWSIKLKIVALIYEINFIEHQQNEFATHTNIAIHFWIQFHCKMKTKKINIVFVALFCLLNKKKKTIALLWRARKNVLNDIFAYNVTFVKMFKSYVKQLIDVYRKNKKWSKMFTLLKIKKKYDTRKKKSKKFLSKISLQQKSRLRRKKFRLIKNLQ